MNALKESKRIVYAHTLSCKRVTAGCKFQRRKKINKARKRVDPPKFMTRMSETSRCKKRRRRVNFSAEFFAARSSTRYLDIVHCQRSETQFHGDR